MNEPYWGCTGCGQEYDEETTHCNTCKSYKYFAWIEQECAVCGQRACVCDNVYDNLKEQQLEMDNDN
jgi:hypothetical protein